MMFGLNIFSDTGGLVLGGGTLLYAISSLIGYLGYGQSPFFRFTRINVFPLFLLVLTLASLGIGGLSFSTQLILLMMVNLYDANCAANNERIAPLTDRITTEQTNPIENFYLTSYRTNSFN